MQAAQVKAKWSLQVAQRKNLYHVPPTHYGTLIRVFEETIMKTYLIGTEQNRRHQEAQLRHIEKHLRKGRLYYNKRYPIEKEEKGFFKLNLIGWFVTELWLILVEVCYLIH